MRGAGPDRRPYSVRYGACDPLLAGGVRAGVYLMWRAVFALFRPTVFVALLGLAALLAHRGLEAAPSAVLQPAPPLAQRIDEALQAAAQAQGRPEQVWSRRMDAALDSGRFGAPDLPLATAYAGALIPMKGRDALALSILAERRRPELVEAELRALPAWRREAVLEEVVRQRLATGRRAGFDPPELVFAPPLTRERFERARTLYGAAFIEADRWFAAPQGRALALHALPGVMADPSAQALLQADVRELVVHGCALARAQSVAPAACRSAALPRGEPDAIRVALALLSYADGARVEGVRVAQAAWVAGRLPRPVAERFGLGARPDYGREVVLAALMPILADAETAFAQPDRFVDAARRAANEHVRGAELGPLGASSLDHALGEVRLSSGALTAVRVSDVLQTPSDAQALAAVAALTGPTVLAVRDLAGPQMLALATAPPVPDYSWIGVELGLALGLSALAICLVLTVLISAARRRAGGPPGALERLDGAVTRLILGRNI